MKRVTISVLSTFRVTQAEGLLAHRAMLRDGQSVSMWRTGSVSRRLCSIALWLLSGLVGAFAQSGSSTMLGTLPDQTGAVVAKANVTLTGVSTGSVRHAVSGETGLFRLLDILPGQYSVVIKAAGFKALEIKDITL